MRGFGETEDGMVIGINLHLQAFQVPLQYFQTNTTRLPHSISQGKIRGGFNIVRICWLGNFNKGLQKINGYMNN